MVFHFCHLTFIFHNCLIIVSPTSPWKQSICHIAHETYPIQLPWLSLKTSRIALSVTRGKTLPIEIHQKSKSKFITLLYELRFYCKYIWSSKEKKFNKQLELCLWVTSLQKVLTPLAWSLLNQDPWRITLEAWPVI